jgi:hypothetical protein
MSTLLSDIVAYCEAQGMKPTRFGELALNDKPFVSQLENGRRVWPETEAKVRRFMATHRPDHGADSSQAAA